MGPRYTWERERERGEEGQSGLPWRCAKGVALPKEGRKTSTKIARRLHLLRHRRRRRQLLGLRGEDSKCRVAACYRRPKGEPKGPRDRAEEDLVACLNADAGCPVEDPERWSAVGRAARSLPSMRMVTHPPKCFTVTAGAGCSSTAGNVETGTGDVGGAAADQGTAYAYDKSIRPANDLGRREMGRCALVGNAPFLKHAKSGRAIDKHKTVWRYNLKGANLAGGAGAEEYTGKKTHVRMFNRLRWVMLKGR